jgi:hypothetical protein
LPLLERAMSGRATLRLRPRATAAAREEDAEGFLKPIVAPGLPDDVASGELAYKSLAARYHATLAQKRQLEAELDDGPSAGRRQEIGNKLNGLNGDLGVLRTVARDAGELAYATMYFRIAQRLLSPATKKALSIATDDVMRRSPHEIARPKKTAPESHHARLKGFERAT